MAPATYNEVVSLVIAAGGSNETARPWKDLLQSFGGHVIMVLALASATL